MPLTLDHHVAIARPRAHLVSVTTTIRSDEPLGALTLFMSVWTPGSYLVREHARHVEGLSCEPAGVRAVKVRKNAWRVECEGARTVTVRYRLYCNELTVRTNHVDETHAFLNGAATFLAVEGHEGASARIEIDAPEGWGVATALARASARSFTAPDLDALVDAPIEIGLHDERRFDVLGVPHQLAVWPRDAVGADDLEKLEGDARAIIACEAGLFGGVLPYEAYVCILHVSPRGRGGMEHAASSVLVASPASFASREAYLDLLALLGHEVFHAWNVKRIRPAALTPYRYEVESYTRLLWWFEGATSYYDWRVLRLAKLCSASEYIEHLAGEIAYLDATPGRHACSLEEASFDAWIKTYRPDENTPNSSVSYYRKGEVVCAMLDLEIRARSSGRASLDAVLEYMWREHGASGVPLPEGAIGGIILRACGVDVRPELEAWVRGTSEIDYDATLSHVGLRVTRTSRGEPRASLGMRLRSEGGRTMVSGISRGGAAQGAGVDVGDELVALGGQRMDGASTAGALRGRRAGDVVEATIARDGRLHARAITLDPPRPDRVKLTADPGASPAQQARYASWLGEAHAAPGAS